MLILLDIDGVMVPASSWKRPEMMDDGFPRFSRKATDSLRKIISEAGASIVLTTSHKSRYDLKKWEHIFSNRGIYDVHIKKLNNRKNYFDRKQELLDWLSNNNTRNYVIIDDDKSLNSLPITVRKRFIQTSPLVGLNEELANSAIQVLINS